MRDAKFVCVTGALMNILANANHSIKRALSLPHPPRPSTPRRIRKVEQIKQWHHIGTRDLKVLNRSFCIKRELRISVK